MHAATIGMLHIYAWHPSLWLSAVVYSFVVPVLGLGDVVVILFVHAFFQVSVIVAIKHDQTAKGHCVLNID